MGYFHAFSNEFMYFLWKYTEYDIIDMINECAAPTSPSQALSYLGDNIFQNRAPLKVFEATSFRKRFRLQYTR